MKWLLLLLALAWIGLLAGCAAQTLPSAATLSASPTASPSATPAATNTLTPAEQITPAPAVCQPAPVVIPTVPAVIPSVTEVEVNTGLHVVGRPVPIDMAAYRLEVSGKVSQPLSLSYDELRCLPSIRATHALVCPGVFVDYPDLTGASLAAVLEIAGPLSEAREIVMTGADEYTAVLALKDALDPRNYLAYQWKDEPLPVLNGFPLRGVFPGQEGNKWVKWLIKIEVR